MGNRNVGFTYKPRKATVAPIIRGQDDWRSTHLRNTAIQRANEVRKQRATFDDPNWIMAQSPETMLDTDFMSKAKPAMVAMQGNRDFFTTDRDEKRNLYQMWVNNMVGGGGAQMLDLRGLPSVVQRNPNKYRRGRTLFQDPSKSAGLGADLKAMLGDISFQDQRLSEENRTSNPAAVRATEYNPFHEEGYGRDFYIDEFGQPLGEKLKGIMKMALPGPLKFLQGKEREPLPSDRSWIPENVGAYNEIPEIPFKDNLSYEPETTWGPDGDPSIMMAGMEPFDPMDITDAIVGDGQDIVEEEIQEDKNRYIDLDKMYHLNPSLPGGASNFSGVQEYLNSIIMNEDNPNYKRDQDDLLQELIRKQYILEGMPQNIDLETRDAEENLKDINRLIQEEHDKQKELGFRYDI